MDGAHAIDFMPAAIDLKRRTRIERELRNMMADAGIDLHMLDRGNYRSQISDWTWSKLAEDLAERIDRGKLG